MSESTGTQTAEDTMTITPHQFGQQLARDYTRDRIRESEGLRAGRAARAERRSRPDDGVAPTPPAAVRRWWVARPTPA